MKIIINIYDKKDKKTIPYLMITHNCLLWRNEKVLNDVNRYEFESLDIKNEEVK